MKKQLIKILTKKSLKSEAFTGEFYQHLNNQNQLFSNVSIKTIRDNSFQLISISSFGVNITLIPKPRTLEEKKPKN